LKGGQKRADSDLIVALDDMPVTSPEVLSKLMEDKAVGDRVKMLLFGAGKFREVTAVLTPAPRAK
jgi:serine protease Do